MKPHLATLLLATSFLIDASCFAENPAHPDVLFIAADDLNDWTGHLGGHPQARTPNIDRLVARGVTFTNAHCAAPACNPSRAALMSGVRPWRTGIYANSDPASGVLRDAVTINRHFLANGYRTFGGGKIYHGYGSEGREDTWTKWKGGFPTTGGSKHNLNGLDRSHFDWGPLQNRTADMGDAKLTDWAIDRLRNEPIDEPMFLAVGYVKPHLPWFVPQEYFDRFPLSSIQLPETTDSDLSDVPSAGIKMAKPDGDHAAVVKANQWPQAVQAYLATISFLDDQVGRLLDGLESSPRAKQTIVVWWTDHGWHLGEKEHWRKFALWNDATHTSFAVAAPGITHANAQCTAPVDYTSVFPTLCDLAGLATPEKATGQSLMPLLRDPQATWGHVAICTHGRGNHAAIDDQYRLIRYADGSEELYHMAADPNEWHNLASDSKMKQTIENLASQLPAIADEIPATNQERKKNKKTRVKE